MTLREAERIAKLYGHAVTVKSVPPSRKDPRLLPASPLEIMIALKLCVAFLIDNDNCTMQAMTSFVDVASVLHMFNESERPVSENFTLMMARRKEMTDFADRVLNYKSDAVNFWELVYSDLGLPYDYSMVDPFAQATPPSSSGFGSFWNWLRGKRR